MPTQADVSNSHVAIAKLYRNRPLTAADIKELERTLIESGIGTPEEIGRSVPI